MAARGSMALGARRLLTSLSEGHVRGGGEGGLGRLRVAEPPVVGDVAREILVHQRRPGPDRSSEVRHRGERLPRDLDRGRSVCRRVAVLGNDERHRIAHVARLVRGEDRPARNHHRGAVVGGQVPQHVGIAAAVPAPVLAGEHGEHAWHGARPLGRYPPDAGMGVGAADEGGVRLSGQADVVHEAPAAGQKPIVLQARLRRTDMRHAGFPLCFGD